MSKRDDHTTQADLPEHDDIGCLVAIEMFYAYIDGELDDPRDIEDFERHMEHCRSCFTRLEMEKLLSERLRRLGEATAPEGLHSRLNKLMDEF